MLTHKYCIMMTYHSRQIYKAALDDQFSQFQKLINFTDSELKHKTKYMPYIVLNLFGIWRRTHQTGWTSRFIDGRTPLFHRRWIYIIPEAWWIVCGSFWKFRSSCRLRHVFLLLKFWEKWRFDNFKRILRFLKISATCMNCCSSCHTTLYFRGTVLTL